MHKKILIAGFACLSVIAVAQSSASKDQAASAAKDQHPKDVATGQASGKTAAPRDVATGQSSGKTVSKPAGSQAVLNSSDAASSEQVAAPRDVATGQSSGKRQYQPVVIMKVQDKATPLAIEQQSPKATGKVMATDDWHVSDAKSSGSNISVPPADLDGDGKADRSATTSSTSNERVAKGDVNGDGKADAAINNSHSNIKNSKDVAVGQTTGKRQHEPVTVTKETDAAPQK